MKKLLLCLSILFALFTVIGCSEKDKEVTGEFVLGNFGFDFKANETYHLVVPIEWTGESPVTIKSIELIKREEKPVNYEEDGIRYEIFGADPLKKSGIYGRSDVGDLKNIQDLEINGEGKIVLKLSMGDVKEDSERRVKINFISDGEKNEKIVVWKTIEQLKADNK